MLSKILRLFGKEKLSNIKILKEFEEHPPRLEKMVAKWIYYWDNDDFSQPIVLNKNNYLVDGYTTYIIAKILKKKYMPVVRI